MFESAQISTVNPIIPVNGKNYRFFEQTDSGNGRGAPTYFDKKRSEIYICIDEKVKRDQPLTREELIFYSAFRKKRRINGSGNVIKEEPSQKYDFNVPITEEEKGQLGELPECDKAVLFAYASGRAERGRFWEDIYEMFKDGYGGTNDFSDSVVQAPADSLPVLAAESLLAVPSSETSTVSYLTKELFSKEQVPTLWGKVKKMFKPVKVCATVGIAAMALSGSLAYKSLQPSRYNLPQTPRSAPLDQTKSITPPLLPELYTAKKGDSLWRIAEKKAKTKRGTNSMVDSIARYNGISREGILRVGQTIILPPDQDESDTGIVNGNTYIVERGDILSGIALSQCGTVAAADEIAKHNGIRDPNVIYAGSRLYIPPCSAGTKSQKLTPKHSASNSGSYNDTFARIAPVYGIESDAEETERRGESKGHNSKIVDFSDYSGRKKLNASERALSDELKSNYKTGLNVDYDAVMSAYNEIIQDHRIGVEEAYGLALERGRRKLAAEAKAA